MIYTTTAKIFLELYISLNTFLKLIQYFKCFRKFNIEWTVESPKVIKKLIIIESELLIGLYTFYT